MHMPPPGKSRNDSLHISPAPAAPPAEASHTAADTTPAHPPDSPPLARPPVSPITPVAKLAQLAPSTLDPADRVIPPPAVDFIPPPPPKPISDADNTDAIALRSAIALLQIQRDKSKKDISTLESIKNAAVAEPEAFIQDLKAGRLRPKHPKGDVLGPTLDSSLDALIHETDSDDSKDVDGHSPASSPSPPPEPKSKFGPVPEPQNIFRCPPVNWAKYHVVGESLDKLHTEQQQRPSLSEPGRGHAGGRAPQHVIAAPYSPFTDRLDQRGAQARRVSKKTG